MADAYERVKGGRLAFKDGSLASRSKTINKKKKKNKKKNVLEIPPDEIDIGNINHNDDNDDEAIAEGTEGAGEIVYTIDAAKKMKYDDLFPVEAKKFGYDPTAKKKSVEDALDDRVKKKADRYCK